MPKDDINYKFTENGIVYDFYDVFVPAENFRQPTLFTFGVNTGDNTTTGRVTPVTTFAGGNTWKSVSSGGYITAAIKTDGTLWTWGSNDVGQLGINNTTERSTPVTTFAGGNNWKQVSCGRYHMAAVKTDGSLWTWGGNNTFGSSTGQLGTNDTANRTTPVTTFTGGTNWKQVSTGFYHTAAIKTDGSLWTWGENDFGQLGLNSAGNNDGRVTPVTTFAGGNDWKQVSCGWYHTAAIKTDGSLWTWGGNNPFGTSMGQLGTNDTANRTTPVTTFAGGNTWKSVDCGAEHTTAIKTDGTLWTWGRNHIGQLGINNNDNRSTPVTTFAGGNNWKQVAGARNYTMAVKTDGTLWGWGEGGAGRIGNNSTGNTNVPVTTFAGGNNWKQVDGGNANTAAIKYSPDP